MAYIDQKSARNQRAAIMIGVAALQGAMIVALVNGLVVHFRPAVAPPHTQATDVPVMPLTPIPPPPPKPPVEPKAHPDPLPRSPLPPLGGRPVDPMPMPSGPPTFPLPQADPPAPPTPRPQPVQAVTVRAAIPRGSPAGWVTTDDYPARDLREGNQGTTRFTLTVGSDGRVQSCAVTQSSGFPGLDAATCDKVSRRARFDPEIGGSGSRVAGTYNGSIRWVIPD